MDQKVDQQSILKLITSSKQLKKKNNFKEKEMNWVLKSSKPKKS